MSGSVGRVPPHSEENEKGVLGCMLLDPEQSLFKIREDHLCADDFYIPSHRIIFDAILETEQRARGGVVDILTVSDTLQSKGLLEKCGGIDYIDGLVRNTPTAVHLGGYLDVVLKKSKRRRLISQSYNTAERAYDENDDIDDAITEAQAILFREAQQQEMVTTNNDAILQVYTELKAARDGHPVGLPHFLPQVNAKLGNYKPGKLHVIGAPPKKGKTTIMCNQAKHWAMGYHSPDGTKVPVAIASIEMDHSEIIGLMVAEHADVSMFAMKTGMRECALREGKDNRPRLQKFLEAAKDFVDADTAQNKIPLYVNDKLMNIDQLCSWARLMVWKHHIQVLFIDYLQLIREAPGYKNSRKEEIDSIINKLVKLAKETNLIVIIASQFTLQARRDNRKPTPSDLKESGSIGESAYSIILIYEWEDQMIADIAYNRGGLTGEVLVKFEGGRQRFRSNVPGDSNAKEERNNETGRLEFGDTEATSEPDAGDIE